MTAEARNLTQGGRLDLALLRELSERPAPFAPGEAHFWDDPHIATQMLECHLSPETDAASRRPADIDAEVAWLWEALGLEPRQRVLDLGCGPGLYAARLAARGAEVTGVDISQGSLDYAARYAREHGLSAHYVCRSFLTIDYEAEFDAAMQVYGELSVFKPQDRDELLRRVHRALVPGGRFAFDVSTPQLHAEAGRHNIWYVSEGGFWKPGPHLVLEQGFAYEGDLNLQQYVVVEANGAVSVYRNWFQEYVPETITPVLERQGYTIEGLWGSLAGAPCRPDGDWLAVVARKRSGSAQA